MNIIRKCLAVISLVAALSVSTITNAAVVSIDWQTAGDSLITSDTTSGLNWLDLTETAGLAQTTILASMGGGGAYAGWRYASSAEVVTLFANFGVDLSIGAPTTISTKGGTVTGLGDVVNAIGDTFVLGTVVEGTYGVYGLTSDTGSAKSGGAGFNYMGGHHSTQKLTTTLATSNLTFVGATSTSDPVGHYLVQTSVVPVPGAVWLFGSGLIGLIGIAKRNAQNERSELG